MCFDHRDYHDIASNLTLSVLSVCAFCILMYVPMSLIMDVPESVCGCMCSFVEFT